jgi:hypothetical protein
MLAVALFGGWVIWSRLSELSMAPWYDLTAFAPDTSPRPAYDLHTLPWKAAQPKAFDLGAGAGRLITSDDGFTYQVYAIVNTVGAKAVDIRFDLNIESGGATVGLMQSGNWLIWASSQNVGRFFDVLSVPLGVARSMTVVIANNNPAGESRVTLTAVDVFLRK